MNVTYEHKPAMTFIGFFTSIRPEEGYQKCPEFWDVVLRLDRVMADRKMSLNELSEKSARQM